MTLTEKGRRIIEDNTEEAKRIVESYKSRLGAARYEALLDLLEDLAS